MTVEHILNRIEESGLEVMRVVEVDVNCVFYVRLSSDLVLRVGFRYDIPEFILARWKEVPPFDYLSWPDKVNVAEFDGLCLELERCQLSHSKFSKGGNLIFLHEFDWLLGVIKKMLA